VRGLIATTSGSASATPRLEPGAHLRGVKPEAVQHRLGPAAGTEDREQDVLRSDGLVAEPTGFLPRLGQGLLGAGTEGAGVDAGCGVGAQSGLASSMSMMGMPSSTA
jgi:hypothetical protein